MNIIVNFWSKRSSYEKAVLGLLAAFAVFCLGFFSGRMYYGSKCDVCRQTLRNGEHYILDVRTGEIVNLSEYIDRESAVCWFSPASHLPQETSITYRRGYVRFPRQAPAAAHYCARHTANLESDFLVLSPVEHATVCYAVPDGQILDPDGRMIRKRLNENLDCWELEISWEITTPVSSS